MTHRWGDPPVFVIVCPTTYPPSSPVFGAISGLIGDVTTASALRDKPGIDTTRLKLYC
jgi:hypothetical protein